MVPTLDSLALKDASYDDVKPVSHFGIYGMQHINLKSDVVFICTHRQCHLWNTTQRLTTTSQSMTTCMKERTMMTSYKRLALENLI